jgi:Mini-chromosome maintenance replisome factor
VDINSPDAILDERAGLYVTCVPGAARWLDPTSLEDLSLEDVPTVLRGDKDRVVSAGQSETGVVVKCYSGVENTVKVCDLVEIIGILEYPEPDEEEGHIDVIIHAITLKKKQLDEIVLATREKLSLRISPPAAELMAAEMSKAKDLFIDHLTQLFEGDDLAAQSILLNLTTPLTHRNPIPLGHLPINIYSTPSATTKALTTFLQSVLPALAIQPLAIDLLNKTPLYPRSDGEKLFAGRGQYVSRTALVIDEAGLQEGKLGDTGVRNLRFLSRIPVAQKLGFEFPFHEFDIDTNLPFLVLGESKSILPVTHFSLNRPNGRYPLPFHMSSVRRQEKRRGYLLRIQRRCRRISLSSRKSRRLGLMRRLGMKCKLLLSRRGKRVARISMRRGLGLGLLLPRDLLGLMRVR